MSFELVNTNMMFQELDERMQWYVDQEILGCVATLVLDGTEIVHLQRHGFMSVYDRRVLVDNPIFRMYSNTKLVTSVALMMLVEHGRCNLDDPLSEYLPNFANVSVLRENAATVADVEPLSQPITLRHLLSHSAGLSYGFLEPRSIVDKAYQAANINPVSQINQTLASLANQLADMPLAFQPGSQWRYSFATDVCARIVEVISGQAFDAFLREQIFTPLEMNDTDFWVPANKRDRLVAMYNAPDLFDPMKGGFNLEDHGIDGRTNKPTFLSGGGGLVSSLSDYCTFIQMIVAGGTWRGHRVLKLETLELMRSNQLADGVAVNFPMFDMPNTVFGLGFAVRNAADPSETDGVIGEYHWGGMAGTHSWISPTAGVAGLCFTQRMPGFWHPFSHDFRRFVYAAKRSLA
ncbi:MAG: CubicO group peptidase (beta-lactamase class C family) [Gammaproteobacteria bacterium]|jgi:CubicO group peptidase (beta-lactamase class C family)